MVSLVRMLHRTTLLGHVERLAGHGEPDYDRIREIDHNLVTQTN